MSADLLTEYAQLRERLASEPGSTLVVFVDLVGSTAFKERFGLLEGALRSDYHNRLVAAIASRHQLRTVKSLGDGLLLAASGLSTAQAASVFGRFASECLSAPERAIAGQPPLVSRIGATFGPVVELTNGDVLGPTVDLAARLESIAKPGQAIAQATLFTADAERDRTFGVGPPVAVAVRGVADPVRVVEVFPGRDARGVDIHERWRDYEYEVSLHALEAARWPRISRDHVEALVRLSYTGVLRRYEFSFVAMEAGSPFSAALRDPGIFSCFYFSPRLFRSEAEALRFFKVERLTVAGVDAAEQSASYRLSDGVFLTRWFAVPTEGLPSIGDPCRFSYTLRTIVPRRSSFFSMIVEQEVESPTFAIRADALDVDWLRFAAFLPPAITYDAICTPDKRRPTSVSIQVEGLVSAGSGVTFMWREGEEAQRAS